MSKEYVRNLEEELVNPMKVVASAPGKIILTGEHAVVYGRMGIATTIDKRAYVEVEKAKDGLVTVESKVFGKHSMGENEIKEAIDELDNLRAGEEFGKIVELAGSNPILPIYTVAWKVMGDEYTPLRIGIDSNIPKNAGGSSAINDSVALGISKLIGMDLTIDEVARLGNEGDKVAHGKASGIDAYTVAYGYWTTYMAHEGVRKLDMDLKLPLILVESGEKARTGETVDYVKELRRNDPASVDSVFDGLHEITVALVGALKAGSVVRIGELFVDYREELRKLGGKLYTPGLERICQIAEENNAYAKPTGGWGGGTCIAVAPVEGELENLIGIYKKEGFTAYKTKLGVEGVRIESVNDSLNYIY